MNHVHVVDAQGIGVDRGASHQLPSWVAEAGWRARCRKHPPPAGFDLLLVHGLRPGTVRGSMPGAQRQFGNGEESSPLATEKSCDDCPASAP